MTMSGDGMVVRDHLLDMERRTNKIIDDLRSDVHEVRQTLSTRGGEHQDLVRRLAASEERNHLLRQ